MTIHQNVNNCGACRFLFDLFSVKNVSEAALKRNFKSSEMSWEEPPPLDSRQLTSSHKTRSIRPSAHAPSSTTAADNTSQPSKPPFINQVHLGSPQRVPSYFSRSLSSLLLAYRMDGWGKSNKQTELKQQETQKQK